MEVCIDACVDMCIVMHQVVHGHVYEGVYGGVYGGVHLYQAGICTRHLYQAFVMTHFVSGAIPFSRWLQHITCTPFFFLMTRSISFF